MAKRLIMFFLGCVGFLPVLAIADDLQRISVDLSTNSVKTAVPFDEPFVVTGSVDAAVERLEFSYAELVDDCANAKKGTVPAPPALCDPAPAGIAPVQTWNRHFGSGNTFEFIVQPLKPYSCYRFYFSQFLHVGTPDERTKLQNELAKTLKTEVAALDPESVDKITVQQMEQRLYDKAADFVKTKLRACLPRTAVDLQNGAGSADYDRLRKAFLSDKNLRKQRDERREDAKSLLCLKGCRQKAATCGIAATEENRAACFSLFRSQLHNVLRDPELLAAGPRKRWDAPVNASREATKSITIGQASAAVSEGLDVQTLAAVLSGTARISGPLIELGTAADPDSIELLADYFQVLSSPDFVLKSGKRLLPEGLAIPNSEIVEGLRQLTARTREVAQIESIEKSPTFADVLAESLVNQDFGALAAPTVITENNNPYISLDLGVAYAFGLSKTFPYYGVNFYAVPVNKKAPLSQFHGLERLKKSASVTLGLTTAAFEDDRAKKLLGAGALVVGGGYRFNQLLKLNGGVVLYKEVAPNPVAPTQRNAFEPFVSISIDMDVKKFIGGLGGLFP